MSPAPDADRRRPHVLVNVAMTADGKIDTVERGGARISSPEDIAAVDALRAEVDAIMVGGATFLAEDPRLTVRDEGRVAARRAAGRRPQPRKVAAVSVLPEELPTQRRFLTEGGGTATIFTTARSSERAISAWRGAGAEVVVHESPRVDLIATVEHLRVGGVARILVEGGGTLIAALFTAGLIDEVRQYIAPFVVGGGDAPTAVDGPGMALDARVDLELIASERLGPGIVLRYRVVRPAG